MKALLVALLVAATGTSPGYRLTQYEERHAQRMALAGTIYHSRMRPLPCRDAGEIVGEGSSVQEVWDAFLDSQPHRRAIHRPRWDRFGAAVVYRPNRLWIGVVFCDK